MTPNPVLVCYDDSPAAREAVREAARLFPDATLRILTVWKRFATPRVSEMIALQPHDLLRMTTALEAEAKAVARAGVTLAGELGAAAEPRVVEASDSVWHSIVDTTFRARYRAVVLGAHGRSALAGAMLGGVASLVAAHAACPVLLVHAGTRPLALEMDDEDVARQLPSLGAT